MKQTDYVLFILKQHSVVCSTQKNPAEKKFKLCFEIAGSSLSSSDQLHIFHGLTSSSYILKRLITGHFKRVIAEFHTREQTMSVDQNEPETNERCYKVGYKNRSK